MKYDEIKSNVLTTTLESAVNWGRKHSLWPMPFGTACCGIEFMAVLAARTDIARFGAEAIRFTPRQSDLLIVAGRISIKMMPVLIRIYEQMGFSCLRRRSISEDDPVTEGRQLFMVRMLT